MYGSGASIFGALGGIIGWPVFMVMDIIVGLFWGMITGEWKDAGRPALTYCWIGIGILLRGDRGDLAGRRDVTLPDAA